MSVNSVVHHRWVRDPNTGELSTILQSGARYDLRRELSALNRYRTAMQTEESDLLDLASTVFGSDRIAPRPHGFRARDLSWSRDLRLEVPVRHPDVWNASQLKALLVDALEELTGDRWSFDFYLSAPTQRSITQLRLQPEPYPVALFSGGLDSLAGVLDLIACGMHGGLRLVSVSSNTHIRHVQQDVFRALQEKTALHLEQFPFRVYHKRMDHPAAQVDATLLGTPPQRNLKEQGRRQRARSFLYFTIATILARRTSTNSIYVLENGVTSLNLPINPVLSSTRVTRTTHPLVLLAFERFIQTALAWPMFRVELPYLLRTKKEIVAPHARRSRDLIGKTVSCARVVNGPWCGTCTACILRRQVLWGCGLSDLDREEQGHYRCDIFDTFDQPGDDVQRWFFLATLDNVAELLQDPRLVTSHPSIIRTSVAWGRARGLDPSGVLNELVDLHRRYAAEWKAVLIRGARRYRSIRRLISRDAIMGDAQ